MSDQPKSIPGSGGDQGQEPVPLQYSSVADFVERYVCYIYNRPLSTARTHWCPQWWCHAEAVEAFTALWQTWEHMRCNEGPAWMAKYKTYYFYAIMDQITGPEGPFHGCSPQKGHNPFPEFPESLPVEKAPAEVFKPRD